jgi:hypothetical protein
MSVTSALKSTRVGGQNLRLTEETARLNLCMTDSSHECNAKLFHSSHGLARLQNSTVRSNARYFFRRFSPISVANFCPRRLLKYLYSVLTLYLLDLVQSILLYLAMPSSACRMNTRIPALGTVLYCRPKLIRSM